MNDRQNAIWRRWRHILKVVEHYIKTVNEITQRLAWTMGRPHILSSLLDISGATSLFSMAASMTRAPPAIRRVRSVPTPKKKDTCSHFDEDTNATSIKRYGGGGMKLSQCTRCLARWRWDEDTEKWVDYEPRRGAPRRSDQPSSRSRGSSSQEWERVDRADVPGMGPEHLPIHSPIHSDSEGRISVDMDTPRLEE